MKGDKQKTSILSLIFGIILGVVGIGLIVFGIISGNSIQEQPSKPPKPSDSSEKEQNKGKVVKLTNDDFSILMPWAKELYESKKYLNFPINSKGIYYLTFEGLKDLGYDVSKLSVSCKPDTNIMFFDLSLLTDGSDAYPISFSGECEVD